MNDERYIRIVPGRRPIEVDLVSRNTLDSPDSRLTAAEARDLAQKLLAKADELEQQQGTHNANGGLRNGDVP